jgi:hypothetical protein
MTANHPLFSCSRHFNVLGHSYFSLPYATHDFSNTVNLVSCRYSLLGTIQWLCVIVLGG